MDYQDQPSGTWLRRNYKTILALVVIVGLAAFFRVAFNYGPALNDGQYRFAGNDDYYHHWVVRHIMEEGRQLLHDDLLNYPVPAVNPRPPLFHWHAAIEGRLLEWMGMSHDHATGYGLEWGNAFWGILTVFPIWLTGRFLYSNRAGLWAGFLIAASPAHIQRGGFGLGDWDAFDIFFLTLGFYFLVRALRGTRDDTRVRTWMGLRSIAEGFGLYVDQHREGLAYGFLAGVCFAVIALAWEGYPYVTAIYAIYYVLQLVTNQVRRRDSTGDVLLMLMIMALMTFVPLPYYWHLGATVHKTITANTYIFAMLVVFTLALVPTRDLPWIVVIPGLLVMLVAGWAVLTFVFPDIGNQVFTANGYFNHSKVYSTIAEAQRTDLGGFVFSIGFMTFFLAMVGSVYAVVRFFKKRERDQLFIVGWALVSIYMAFAATRFVFNAAPVFAIVAGWMVDKIVAWMNWRERLRDFRGLRHESFGKALRSTLGAKQIMGALFIGLTLVVPNVWFSFDAGLPSEARDAYLRGHTGSSFWDKVSRGFVRQDTGAFGQGFLAPDWLNVYGWLAKQDTKDANGNPVACAHRPAQMAWWDYGFWEIDIACHPSVADNFQNGVQISGRFLAAQSEKEGIEWMSVRVIEGAWRTNDYAYPASILDALRKVNASLPAQLPATLWTTDYDTVQKLLAAQSKDADGAAAIYDALSDATGYDIGYFLTDFRMLPYDDPSTPNIESSSIFYAPVYLANKNPDDYVQTVYVAQGGTEYRVVGYTVDADGTTRQLNPPKILGPDGNTYVVGGGSIVRTIKGRIDYTHNNGNGVPLQSVKLDLKPAFYASMFYRGYVGGTGGKPANGQNYDQQLPGNDLSHFRIVRTGDPNLQHNTVVLLTYYRGAPLDGRVTVQGAGVADVTVESVDEHGARHGHAVTDANGHYRLLLPPSLTNDTTGQLQDVKVGYSRGGVLIGNATYKVTQAMAAGKAPLAGSADLALLPGNLDVFAYRDRDRNGTYNASMDLPAAGANVTFGGQTLRTGPDGHALFANVVPGGADVTGSLKDYTAGTAHGAVRSGQTGSAQLAFDVKTQTVNGTVKLADGTPVSGVQLSVVAKSPKTDFTQDGAVQTTKANGTFSVPLYPGGTYRFFVNETKAEGGKNVTYRTDHDFEYDVLVGHAPPTVQIVVTRTER